MVLEAVLTRVRFAWAYLGPRRRAVVVVLSALCGISTLRGQLIPNADIAIINFIPPFPWYIWGIIFLFVLLVFAVEDGYRIQQKLIQTPTNLKPLIERLEEQLAIGKEDMSLGMVALMWHRNDGSKDLNEGMGFTTKLMRLKIAVSTGLLSGQKVVNAKGQLTQQTLCKTSEVINYFKSL